MYTATFGVPDVHPPNFYRDVVFGVVGIISVATAAFLFVQKYIASEPSPASSPEWREHTKALARKQNASMIDKYFDE